MMCLFPLKVIAVLDQPQKLFNMKSQLQLLSENCYQKPEIILLLANIFDMSWITALPKPVSSIQRLNITLHIKMYRISYDFHQGEVL